MTKKSDVKVDGQLFIGEDSVIRCEDDKTEITESNLREYADMLQFDTLAQECILEDLCRSYNISREDMFVLIHELKKRGNNIVTLNTSASHDGDDLKTQVTLIRNFGHEELINDLSYNIIDNDENIKVMLISDTRFGSIYQQTTILNDMYLKAKEMGVKYVFLTGDVVEGIYRGAKSIYNTTLHKDGYDDQADYVAACFPRIQGITTYFVTGEHDLSFLKGTDKVDIGKLIAAKRDDMIYLGPKRKKVSFVTGDRRSGSISFYLQHSSGNVPYTISYKPQQKISSLRNEDKTDILVTSHFAACDSFLRRGVRSYQVPTVTATTDEMKDANTPVYNTIGAWVVSLDRDKKGSLKRTSQMYIPYYKTIKDDYKTFKKLEDSDHILVQVPEKSLKDDRDKMFSQIRNGESVDKICERLGVSQLKFGGIVEELRHRGYDISIDESSENKVVIKKNKGKNNKTIKPNIDELKKIRQVWISDTHLCNEAQQLNLINKIYREAAERGIDTVLHFGDVLDGDYHNRPEHQYALFRLGATRQLEYLTNYYPKVEGIETYFITGTHDQTHCKNGGVFVGPAIEEKRPDMHFLGDDMGIYHPLGSKKTSIEMFHPGGGCSSSLSYKMQKYIDKMEPGTKPNIIGSGHFHQSHMMAYRNVIAFLIPCLTSKTNFAIRQGLENTMGAYFIDMYVNDDGDIEMIEFEEKRFTEKDIKKDDYMKTKQLVLKKKD
ncbi:MAG: metallophosphoesterase [Bacilli bacterium]